MNSNQFRYYLSPASRDIASEPMIPLPGFEEGGPVYPGNDIAAEPMIPLPDFEEGGPVYPGNDASTPSIPLPNPEEGFPAYPGEVIAPPAPIVTWPPSNSGNGSWNRPGTARVRFLNAAYGYSAFRVSVSNSRFVDRLNYASVTGYGRVRAGYQTVTVSGTNGRLYLQRSVPFQTNGLSTVAIIKTANGLDLLQIPDSCCPPGNGYASFRVGNLAYNSRPLDVLMSDGRVVYGDLRYKEVAAFRRILPGTYQFFYADTGLSPMPASLDIERLDSAWLGVYPPYETFGSLYLNVSSGEIYTIYLLQKGSGRNNIQNMILVDG